MNTRLFAFVGGETGDRAVGFGGTKVPYVSKDNGLSWQKK